MTGTLIVIAFLCGVCAGVLGLVLRAVFQPRRKYSIQMKSKVVWEEYYLQTTKQFVRNILN